MRLETLLLSDSFGGTSSVVNRRLDSFTRIVPAEQSLMVFRTIFAGTFLATFKIFYLFGFWKFFISELCKNGPLQFASAGA